MEENNNKALPVEEAGIDREVPVEAEAEEISIETLLGMMETVEPGGAAASEKTGETAEAGDEAEPEEEHLSDDELEMTLLAQADAEVEAAKRAEGEEGKEKAEANASAKNDRGASHTTPGRVPPKRKRRKHPKSEEQIRVVDVYTALGRFYDSKEFDENLKLMGQVLAYSDEAGREEMLDIIKEGEGFLVLYPREEDRREKFFDYGFAALAVTAGQGTRIDKFPLFGRENPKGSGLTEADAEGNTGIIIPFFLKETPETEGLTLGAIGVPVSRGAFPLFLEGATGAGYLKQMTEDVINETVYAAKGSDGSFDTVYVTMNLFARPGVPLGQNLFKERVLEAFRVLNWFLDDTSRALIEGANINAFEEIGDYEMNVAQRRSFEDWWTQSGGYEGLLKRVIGDGSCLILLA